MFGREVLSCRESLIIAHPRPTTCSTEEIPAATLSATQALLRTVASLFLELISSLIRDRCRLLALRVIKGKLCSPRDEFRGKEGYLVDADVGMIV